MNPHQPANAKKRRPSLDELVNQVLEHLLSTTGQARLPIGMGMGLKLIKANLPGLDLGPDT